jgi:hypothetical protein
LSACASTAITPISKNQVLVSTSAEADCGKSGAVKVANQMAAVATLRAGYERYVITAGGTQNNTQTLTSGPVYSNTYSSASVYGNSVYGTSTTYYGGQFTYQTGSHDAEFAVTMLKPGDRGFNRGIDAKTTLGKDWEKKVRDGVNSCL